MTLSLTRTKSKKTALATGLPKWKKWLGLVLLFYCCFWRVFKAEQEFSLKSFTSTTGIHWKQVATITSSFQSSQSDAFVKDIVLMSRTYSGDRFRMGRGLLLQLDMFFDLTAFDFTFVLDDESSDDHLWGRCLEGEGLLNSKVKYEALPLDAETLFQGISFGNSKQYSRPGYDRQQWSTFHLDLMADPSHQVIGVIDADAEIFSYLTRENIFAPDGRIILRAAKAPSHYDMDKVALGVTATPYDFMWIDRMPIWFWKSTFANVRNHIASHWNASFNDAFRNFSTSRYSQFNIMAHYAVSFEPDRYLLVDHTSSNGTVSIGCNRCIKEDVAVGCCAVFNVSCTSDTTIKRRSWSVNRYNNYKTVWEDDISLAERHFAYVQRDLSLLEKRNITVRERMRDACIRYTSPTPNAPRCTSLESTTRN